MGGIRVLLDGKIWEWDLQCKFQMGMGMKSLKWEGIGPKNLLPHTSTSEAGPFMATKRCRAHSVGDFQSLHKQIL